VFRKGNPKPLKIQRFQDMQFLPFSTKRQKNPLRFQRFSGQRAGRAHYNRGAIEWEAMKFSVRERWETNLASLILTPMGDSPAQTPQANRLRHPCRRRLR